MDFKHLSGAEEARRSITAIVAERRARLFMESGQPTPDTDGAAGAPPNLEAAEKRTDYLLHSFHAALSSHRALLTCYELLRSAVRLEVGCELGDDARKYIAHLAANPPGGNIDLVTYEHVAALLAIKDAESSAAGGATA